MLDAILPIFVSISLIQGGFSSQNVLAERSFSMSDRYSNEFVNKVFRDNMLLTLNFLKNGKKISPISWSEVEKPLYYEFELKPKSVFAFHDAVSAEYKNKNIITTNAHFSAYEGFKSSGWLYGDGVCQLASLINWAARDAGLQVHAPTSHDFAKIPGVPKEYGVSIYATGTNTSRSQLQNLYITNNKSESVKFAFHYDGQKLNVLVKKV